MQSILKFWKSSLSFLIPSNLKNFFLITINSTYQTYVGLFKGAWRFLLAILLGTSILMMIIFSETLNKLSAESKFIEFFMFGSSVFLLILITSILIFIIICSARSSVDLKNNQYFVKEFKQFFLSYFLTMIVFGSFFLASFHLIMYLWAGTLMPASYIVFAYTFFIMVLAIFTFFLLDSKSNFKNLKKSFLNTLKFLFYNFPMLLILAIIFSFFSIFIFFALFLGSGLLGYSAKYLLSIFPIYIVFIFLFYLLLTLPIYINLTSNIYIKKIYEDSKIYLKNL